MNDEVDVLDTEYKGDRMYRLRYQESAISESPHTIEDCACGESAFQKIQKALMGSGHVGCGTETDWNWYQNWTKYIPICFWCRSGSFEFSILIRSDFEVVIRSRNINSIFKDTYEERKSNTLIECYGLCCTMFVNKSS